MVYCLTRLRCFSIVFMYIFQFLYLPLKLPKISLDFLILIAIEFVMETATVE